MKTITMAILVSLICCGCSMFETDGESSSVYSTIASAVISAAKEQGPTIAKAIIEKKQAEGDISEEQAAALTSITDAIDKKLNDTTEETVTETTTIETVTEEKSE